MNLLIQKIKHKNTPYVIFSAFLIIKFLIVQSVWNYSDSFWFLTGSFKNLFPNHPILYPGFIHAVNLISENQYFHFYSVKIAQNLLFLISVLYAINSFREKLLVSILFSTFTSILLIQNGVFAESFHISFAIIYLTELYKLNKYKSLDNKNSIIIFFSLSGLILTRQIGVLFLFPALLILMLNYNKINRKTCLSIFFVLTMSFSITSVTNTLMKHKLNTVKVQMYGFPARKIINEIFENYPNHHDKLRTLWFNKTEDKELLHTKILIYYDLCPESTDITTQLVEYLKKDLSEYDQIKLKERSEILLNKAYINFLKTLHPIIYYHFFSTTIKYFTSYWIYEDLLGLDKGTKNEKINEKYNYPEIGRFNYTENNFVIKIYTKINSNIDHITSKASAWALICSFLLLKVKRYNNFEISMIIFYAINTSILSVTTVYLPRYALVPNILLFYILLSLVEDQKLEQNMKNFLYYITNKLKSLKRNSD